MAVLLKDIFDEKLVKKLASEIKGIYSAFNKKKFFNRVLLKSGIKKN